MRKKIAALTYFKFAQEINSELSSISDFEEKKGKIMVASQGKNSSIYDAHRKFAKLVIELIEND